MKQDTINQATTVRCYLSTKDDAHLCVVIIALQLPESPLFCPSCAANQCKKLHYAAKQYCVQLKAEQRLD